MTFLDEFAFPLISILAASERAGYLVHEQRLHLYTLIHIRTTQNSSSGGIQISPTIMSMFNGGPGKSGKL